tara:strand:- start:9368 stop:12328 length:2961 start_codon:yes stop_codon:yes gene_type:complete
MLGWLFKRFQGRHYRKFLDACKPLVEKINAHEQEYQSLSDDQLIAKTQAFKDRLAQGEALDSLLPEAYAVAKNAARRLCGKTITVCDQELTWDMVHYDVQLIGGIALHQNKVAEMATGEGKTLVATLPLYLNALTGKNCQLVTVNDYLARRDSQWMGQLFTFLGLTVGCIQNSMSPEERTEAYACDITYGTSSEFGFDYLRDNGMATRKEDQVQREHYFCIIDEADSILIDEARTPLIISGPVQEDREAPFQGLKSDVQKLVTLQQKLCTRLAAEAEELLKSGNDDAVEEALEKLLQVKLGMPKNKKLLRLMESGQYRNLFEKYEVEMKGDLNRNQFYELKEELYFIIDEKQRQSDLTQKGRDTLRPNAPDAFLLPDLPTLFSDLDKNTTLRDEEKQQKRQVAEEAFAKISEEIHCLSQLLRAYCLYERDVEYVVQGGKVVIIDENTGRAMPGRRWSEGLHQAVEAKEGVQIETESKTYATITVQNFFRMYEKLSGMTGTAETEAAEFYDIYKLSVVTIPTHRKCIRKDLNDVIYKSRRAKYNAAIQDIEAAHKKGQPVLVGTVSVEASEVLSKLLKRQKIPHSVLNAKFHEQEAEIVARAGARGAVTIATNMAGRGTDIKLGEGVEALGGLLVLGTERHESRRIDRQLRGRCSRQGDSGTSGFYVSLEDDLMRLFASSGPIASILQKSFSEEDELEHPLLNRSIESAQKKVEQHNYSIRKRLLQYDDVLNKQREIIYGIRNDAILSEHPKEVLFDMIEDELRDRVDEATASRNSTEDLESFLGWINMHFPVSLKLEDLTGKDQEALVSFLRERIERAFQSKEDTIDPKLLLQLERYAVIYPIDKHWQDHLTEMEELRRSVGLRGYGQKDPLNEYKSEAFLLFEEMIKRIRGDICIKLFRTAANLVMYQKVQATRVSQAQSTHPTLTGSVQSAGAQQADGPAGTAASATATVKAPSVTVTRDVPKVGRNDLCPCGSGKKYKKCCGS